MVIKFLLDHVSPLFGAVFTSSTWLVLSFWQTTSLEQFGYIDKLGGTALVFVCAYFAIRWLVKRNAQLEEEKVSQQKAHDAKEETLRQEMQRLHDEQLAEARERAKRMEEQTRRVEDQNRELLEKFERMERSGGQ